MTMALRHRVPAPAARRTGAHGDGRWSLLPATAIGTSCVSLAVLVGLDGSPIWRVVRVAAVVLVCVATLAVGSEHRTVRTLGLAAVGCAALVAGAAIGVAHVAAGSLLAGAAGLVALVSGTILLLIAAVGSWVNAGGWGRVRVLVVAFVLVQWVLFPLSTAVFATNRAPMPLPDGTPADVGLAYRDVELATNDGVRLAAWYVPSTNGAAVVLLHGAGSTRASVLDHAEVLATRGFGVLLLDARGHGGSSGHAMDLGWYGDADVAAAVDLLREQPDVTAGVGAVGLSMGGEEAIGAAASVGGLDAVVAEGATGRRGADHLPLHPTGPSRVTSGLFYAVQDAAAAMLSASSPPTDLRTAVLQASPRPLLLIAAGNVPREAEAGRRLQRAAPDRVQLWEIPGASHTGALAAAPDAWEAIVTDFLEDALLD